MFTKSFCVNDLLERLNEKLITFTVFNSHQRTDAVVGNVWSVRAFAAVLPFVLQFVPPFGHRIGRNRADPGLPFAQGLASDGIESL